MGCSGQGKLGHRSAGCNAQTRCQGPPGHVPKSWETHGADCVFLRTRLGVHSPASVTGTGVLPKDTPCLPRGSPGPAGGGLAIGGLCREGGERRLGGGSPERHESPLATRLRLSRSAPRGWGGGAGTPCPWPHTPLTAAVPAVPAVPGSPAWAGGGEAVRLRPPTGVCPRAAASSARPRPCPWTVDRLPHPLPAPCPPASAPPRLHQRRSPPRAGPGEVVEEKGPRPPWGPQAASPAAPGARNPSSIPPPHLCPSPASALP